MPADTLIARVQAYSVEHQLLDPAHRVIVAVSGGVDSLVLLHSLHQIGGYDLHVATLDHGIRGAASAADADFVRQTAAAWNLPVTVGRADVPAYADRHSLGLEDAARRVRYTFLLRIAQAIRAEQIALAHNQDDQAETVLMHLIRGAGLAGLRGMLPATKFELGRGDFGLAITFEPPLPDPPDYRETSPPMRLVRPLLATSRAEIEAYARAHNLTPRDDATNTDPAYLRNRIRHEVIPLLETINPNLRATLARTADIVRDDAAWIAHHIHTRERFLLLRLGPSAVAVDRALWAELETRGEQRAMLRALFQKPYMRDANGEIGLDHINRLIALMEAGAVGSIATLPGNREARVGYDMVFIYPNGTNYSSWIDAPALDSGEILGPFAPAEPFSHTVGIFFATDPNDGSKIPFLELAWTFSSTPLDPGADLTPWHADPLAAALSVPADADLMLRTRQPGDRWQPRGLGGRSQKLKTALQSMRVPEGWRDRIPLLTVNGEIAWFVVPDFATAEQASHTPYTLRGRVGHPFAYPPDGSDEPALPGTKPRIDPDEGANRVLIGVRWIRNSDL